jgi:carboxyl-terminal processing protease
VACHPIVKATCSYTSGDTEQTARLSEYMKIKAENTSPEKTPTSNQTGAPDASVHRILLSDATPTPPKAESPSEDVPPCAVGNPSWEKKYQCETNYIQSQYYSREKLEHSKFPQDVLHFTGHIKNQADYVKALTKTALDVGDAWTYFKSDDKIAEEAKHSNEGYRSSGIWLKDKPGGPIVEAVLFGFPAYKMLRPGDELKAINGTQVSGRSAQSLEPLLEGKSGEELTLAVKTKEGKDEIVKFALGDPKVLPSSATVVKDESSGKTFLKLQMLSFSKEACDDLEDAIKAISSKDLSTASGVILDLRGNEGGAIPPIVRTADMFVPPGRALFKLDGRDGSETIKSHGFAEDDYTLDASTRRLLRKLPLVVMIDGTTRSAPETLLGALQEQKRVAAVVGTKSYGKGVVYYDMDAPEGGMRVSQEIVRTPKGRDWHGKGITPDVIIDNPRDSDEDVQLQAAMKIANKMAN